MNIFLWVVQIMLAAVFLTFGLAKAVVPIASIRKVIFWVEDFSELQVRGIGVLETLGGLGLFFPGLFPFPKMLISVAALLLAVLMLLAAVVNYKRREHGEMWVDILLVFALLFVAVLRFVMIRAV